MIIIHACKGKLFLYSPAVYAVFSRQPKNLTIQFSEDTQGQTHYTTAATSPKCNATDMTPLTLRTQGGSYKEDTVCKPQLQNLIFIKKANEFLTTDSYYYLAMARSISHLGIWKLTVS